MTGFLRDTGGLLAFRARALRDLAARQAILPSWLWLSAGLVSFATVRSVVYADLETRGRGHGLVGSFLGSNVVQGLLFLAFLYVPALICLSNAFAGDGLGFSFSREEYRRHVSVLFPLWGTLLLAGSVVQAIAPRFLAIGVVEISVALLWLALVSIVYSVWGVKELNYIPVAAALGVFVLSWATLPVFFVLTRFVLALPFFLLLPVAWIVASRVRELAAASAGERNLSEHLHTLTLNPSDADAHYQLGLIHLRRRNFETARGYFEEALRIDARDPDYHYCVGRVFEATGDWGRALECYEETYRLNPEYAVSDVVREVGKGYLHTGNEETGVEFLRFFLERRGSDPEARYWLAVALEKLGRCEDMRAELGGLLEQARSNPRFFRKGNREWLYRARMLLRSQGK
jgi:tetratricopeptide (TPR) repeat protein